MKKISNIEGYVIRVSAYKESDAVITVLSKTGLFSFLARGVMKTNSKNAAACQLLTFADFSLIENNPTSFSLKESKPLIQIDGKDQLDRLATFSFLCELTAKTVQGDDAQKVFPWLDSITKAIANGADPLTESLIYFAQILEIEGYGLNVDSCVYCGTKKDIVGVSYSDGGFVCRKDLANESQKQSARVLKILRFIFRCSEADITRVTFTKKECHTLLLSLSRYFCDLTGVVLKSLTILEKA